MPKRNITHKSGKQLYLNKMFLKGMLYTSSEMQEGFAKVIDNYDIAPTGDAASPRQPFIIPYSVNNIDFKYTVPAKFKQLKNSQAYIRFKRTVSEKDFIEDKIEVPTDNPGKTIDILYRNSNAFNSESLSLEQLDYNIIEDSDNDNDNDNSTIDTDINLVDVSLDSDTYGITVSENTELSNRTEAFANTPITVYSTADEEVYKTSSEKTFSLSNLSAMNFIEDINVPCKLQLDLRLKHILNISDRAIEIRNTFSEIIQNIYNDGFTNINSDYVLNSGTNVTMELCPVDTSNHIFKKVVVDNFKINYRGIYSANKNLSSPQVKTFTIAQIAKNGLAQEDEPLLNFLNEAFLYADQQGTPNPSTYLQSTPYAAKPSFFGFEASPNRSSYIYRCPKVYEALYDDERIGSTADICSGANNLILRITVSGNNLGALRNNLKNYLGTERNAFHLIANYFSDSITESLFFDNQSIESYTSSEAFITKEQTLEDTSMDAVIGTAEMQTLLNEIDTELNTDFAGNTYTIMDTSKLEVIDGDTFKYDDKKYRLWAADSVEENYKWYHYAKWFLHSFLHSTDNLNFEFNYKSDSYDREVSDIKLVQNYIKDTPNYNIEYAKGVGGSAFITDSDNISYTIYLDTSNPNAQSVSQQTIQYTSLSRIGDSIPTYNKSFTSITKDMIVKKHSIAELFLKTGIYTLRHGIENYATKDEIDVLSGYQEDAITDGYYRWWSEELFPDLHFTDPYYSMQNIFVNVEEEDTSLKITDNMYIEALKISDEYSISAITKTKIDTVQTEYIDYLDAIGFLGRVINHTTGSLVYKGLILLKAELTDEGTPFFRILLPNNYGEGYEPSILDAVENGYNLYNSELLHIKDTEDTDSAFSINGLAILKTDYDKDTNSYTVDKDNPVLITRAALGQVVSLEAMLNQGYYINKGVYNTDKWGYNIYLEIPSIVYTNKDNVQIADKKVIETIIKQPSNTSNIYYYTKDLHELLKDNYSYDNISFDNVVINKVELVSPDNEVITILSEKTTIDLSTNFESVVEVLSNSANITSLFELKFKVSTNELHEHITFEIYDNFSAVNKTIDVKGTSLSLIDRTQELDTPKQIYSQWFVSNYGSDVYEPIQEEVHLYTCTGTVLTKQEGASEDLIYSINRTGPLTFKFRIVPKVRIASSAEHPLYDYFITNSYEEMYQVYPRLDISNDINYVSTKSLIKNINIKNATRLGIFNRQLILYGNDIGSNILQFSKFEYYDYFPFPLNTIEIPEEIVYVSNYKDSLIIFGKTSMYMLSGGTSIQECSLNKIYENLSCKLPDIRLIKPIGNNLMFFNNGTGYIITPNIYVDSSSNIKVYKLTEYINNFIYNPEEYIRVRLEDKGIPITSTPTYTMTFESYIENNTINIVANIEVFVNKTTYYLTVIFIYHQDYRYWRMYSVDIFDSITTSYVCEPNLNTQFIVKKQDKYYLSYMANGTSDFRDVVNTSTGATYTPIITTIMSGYLSVDTMNDKRFKDIIIEFDKINSEDILNINFEFFVDSSPIVLSSENVLVIDKLSNSLNSVSTDKILTDFSTYSAYHISQTEIPTTKFKQPFGVVFDINNQKYSITGRTHIRIPVFGKGRLPSFILKIKANKFYEFINYALIYKEKNINRRS